MEGNSFSFAALPLLAGITAAQLRCPVMKLLRWLPVIALAVCLFLGAWIWWNRPQRGDLANYVPADALVYLECNSLLGVMDAIAGTAAWKELRPLEASGDLPNRWLTMVVSWTGIGPIRTVILARAQLAGVMLDLGAKEEGETLTIKPEAVLLLETHTGERRIRATVEETLKLFAEKSFRQPTVKRTAVAGSEFMVWSEPTSDRQLVATIDGTLVIVGNSERAVKACVEVRRGQRPNLRSNPELQKMRQHFRAGDSLAFGFISSSNAARLFSLGAPLLFGRAPGDVRFDRIISASASKVLAAVGWSSRPWSGGIEDRYVFSLQTPVVERLQPQFRPIDKPIQVLDLLPEHFYSATIYRFENPAGTWQLLETTLSSQLDTLSAILVTSLQKSALTPYGIQDPDKFLNLVGPELTTVRLTPDTERSTLIADVRDEVSLRQLLLGAGERNHKRISAGQSEIFELPDKSIAVSFLGGRVLIGPSDDIKLHLQDGNNPSQRNKNLDHFLNRSESANVVTYTEDSDRIMEFVRAVVSADGRNALPAEYNEYSRKTRMFPYAATETNLTAEGFERITRSSFGQFATLVPLLFPEQ